MMTVKGSNKQSQQKIPVVGQGAASFVRLDLVMLFVFGLESW